MSIAGPKGERLEPGSVLTPIARRQGGSRTSDRVFAQLLAAIRDLRLEPGRSLSEPDLAKQLRLSRTPLREAIARLMDMGLVEVVPQVGTHVSLIRMNDVEEARFIRENLELAAFEVACTSPVRDVSALRTLLKRQEAAHADGDLGAFFAADDALHEQIFALSGYPGAWQVVQRRKFQLDRLRYLSLPEPTTIRELISDHTLIVDALEHGRLAEGRAHISTHARRALAHAPGLRKKHPDYFE